MLTRRTLLRVPVFSYFLPFGRPASGATRRALLVGINEYVAAGQSSSDEEPAAGAHATASAKIQRSGFNNLDGAVNDAKLMNELLKVRFGFSSSNVVFLRDRQATRSRILQEFQKHLIDAAAAGDVSLFYYAGHGSQVKNLASEEADQLDETLVPADALAGARDIRDKEMASLYRAAAKKGILLTVVLDSCHSGGMSRGVWNQSGKTRYVPPDPRPVSDPDRDPATGKKPPDAASMGVLFLKAAREDQPSRETVIIERGANGVATEVKHGAFTAALARVFQSPMADQSVEQICERVQAMLASEGQVQVPICAGRNRARLGLLGQPAGLGASIAVPVLDTSNEGRIRLRGGYALGLATGCTLIRTSGQPVRLELTRVESWRSVQARYLGGAS
ncbi:MAG: hypothetical protein DMF60_18325 [Acidobacteria bacterium]|nr:MAG: hypothetical protein DMF60_18325 [Acidobacteriota bacterium]